MAAVDEGERWYIQKTENWNKKVFDSPKEEVFKERYTLSILTDIMNSTIAAVGGVTKVSQGPNGPVYVQEGGAIDFIANLTGILYTAKPASSIEYLADLGQNLGIVKPAYAQGLGFSAFSPALRLWKLFRDIAYLGFVVIFIIVGFMVMFRKRIDPRTVVTIQEALPRIVMCLLLITFSYAIAGFIIDAGGFLTQLIGSTLKSAGLIAVEADPLAKQVTLTELYSQNVFALVNPLRNVEKLVKGIQGTDIPLAGDLPFGLGALTIGFIFWIAGIFIMFKIFFALLAPYIGIVLSVIFAPLMLLPATIPGANNALTSWIRGLLANVLVFPVTFAMLAIAAAIKGTETQGNFGPNAYWGLPQQSQLQIGWSPALIGNWGGVLGDLLAFGILFTVPKVVEMVQSVFQIKPEPWQGAAAAEIKGTIGGIPVLGGLVSRAMG